MTDQNNVSERLKSAQEECDRLRAENMRLRAMLGIQDSISKDPSTLAIPIVVVPNGNIAAPSTKERKIALFRSLFRGREDVYAVRWERKCGKSGYSPGWCHGLAHDSRCKTGRTKEGCTEDTNASTEPRTAWLPRYWLMTGSAFGAIVWVVAWFGGRSAVSFSRKGCGRATEAASGKTRSLKRKTSRFTLFLSIR